mmetsp:Transcript_5598/g.8502  ORF Transcript_5598/g.8502 Transcript_5598/m.8502 type:complete len:122 (+) Transcript_5598:501-866(+)
MTTHHLLRNQSVYTPCPDDDLKKVCTVPTINIRKNCVTQTHLNVNRDLITYVIMPYMTASPQEPRHCTLCIPMSFKRSAVSSGLIPLTSIYIISETNKSPNFNNSITSASFNDWGRLVHWL